MFPFQSKLLGLETIKSSNLPHHRCASFQTNASLYRNSLSLIGGQGSMLQKMVVVSFGGLGLLWYYICLIVIGFQTSTDPEGANFREFMSLSITTIGVVLATFVGMLLGLQNVSEGIKEGVRKLPASNPELDEIARGAAASYIQWTATLLYAVSLPLALCCWWYIGEVHTDAAIKNLGKSTLGVVGGALSVFLVPKR